MVVLFMDEVHLQRIPHAVDCVLRWGVHMNLLEREAPIAILEPATVPLAVHVKIPPIGIELELRLFREQSRPSVEDSGVVGCDINRRLSATLVFAFVVIGIA